jgi:hypothetical protein
MASQPNRLKNNDSALFSLCLDRVPSKGQLYESMLCLKTILSQILEPLEPKWYHANDEGHTVHTYVRLVYKLFMHKHCDMTVSMLMHNRTDINFSSLETV